MENTKKSQKEISSIVFKTITEINKSKKITNKIISEICEKNQISEKYIRLVGKF